MALAVLSQTPIFDLPMNALSVPKLHYLPKPVLTPQPGVSWADTMLLNPTLIDEPVPSGCTCSSAPPAPGRRRGCRASRCRIRFFSLRDERRRRADLAGRFLPALPGPGARDDAGGDYDHQSRGRKSGQLRQRLRGGPAAVPARGQALRHDGLPDVPARALLGTRRTDAVHAGVGLRPGPRAGQRGAEESFGHRAVGSGPGRARAPGV